MAARQCKHGHAGVTCTCRLAGCTHIAVVVAWEVEDLPLSCELQRLKVKAADPLQTVPAGAHITTVLTVGSLCVQRTEARRQLCTPCLQM
jgi:hypothetical protein